LFEAQGLHEFLKRHNEHSFLWVGSSNNIELICCVRNQLTSCVRYGEGFCFDAQFMRPCNLKHDTIRIPD
jgi:hypothetical protein